MLLVLENARLLDVHHERDDRRYSILIENGRIREVTAGSIVSEAERIDVGGRTVMPGMIDCHVHVVASLGNLGDNGRLPNSLAVLRAVPILAGMLRRGFTTVRDAGGADFALAQAVRDGLIPGPRLFVAGKALSQTGGHGDFRDRFDDGAHYCSCHLHLGEIGRIVDGVDAVVKAVREEMRGGADQIKIMASGGVTSPSDPIDNLQFTVAEITAIVETAASHQTYVMAHAYTAASIQRAVSLGVRTIEHGNLVNDEAAATMAQFGAYAVPTLATYDAMARIGRDLGATDLVLAKNEVVRERGLSSLEIYRRNGVKIGFGTDLLGAMHRFQSDEFKIRAEVLSPFEVICQATSIGAEIVRKGGELGVISPGAIADLLVVNGNPCADIERLGGQGEHIYGVIKEGRWMHRDAALRTS